MNIVNLNVNWDFKAKLSWERGLYSHVMGIYDSTTLSEGDIFLIPISIFISYSKVQSDLPQSVILCCGLSHLSSEHVLF